jgi:hypothetical protein|tara:strand:+ start:484 stop:1236 length:753 start_codon:yes stop_codon:yes gene_type:complete
MKDVIYRHDFSMDEDHRDLQWSLKDAEATLWDYKVSITEAGDKKGLKDTVYFQKLLKRVHADYEHSIKALHEAFLFHASRVNAAELKDLVSLYEVSVDETEKYSDLEFAYEYYFSSSEDKFQHEYNPAAAIESHEIFLKSFNKRFTLEGIDKIFYEIEGDQDSNYIFLLEEIKTCKRYVCVGGTNLKSIVTEGLYGKSMIELQGEALMSWLDFCEAAGTNRFKTSLWDIQITLEKYKKVMEDMESTSDES